MKTLSIITVFALTFSLTLNFGFSQNSKDQDVHYFEEQLFDYMEILDTVYLKEKLEETKGLVESDPSILNQTRWGILCHEAALNLTASNPAFKGNAERAYQLLSKIEKDPGTPEGLLPYVSAYRASSLALVAGESRSLKLLKHAFSILDSADAVYGNKTYPVKFLRGSIAENLPPIFGKKKVAVQDFTDMIEAYEQDPHYASPKVMSFTYWAWANLHAKKRYRAQSIGYLEKAIRLDPDGEGGKERAEALLAQMDNR